MINPVSEIIECNSYLNGLYNREFSIYELEDWIEESTCILDFSGTTTDKRNWAILPGICYLNCFYSFYDELLFSRDRSILLFDRKMNILQSSVCAFALYKANFSVIQAPVGLDELEQIKEIITSWI
jgi:hypothetical protein